MLSFLESIPMDTPIHLRNRTICECLYGMGLRVSELSALCLDHINIEEGECRVIGKGDKERIALFGTITQNIIKQYLKYAFPIWKKTNTKTLIINKNGMPLSDRSIQRIVKQCSIKQGIHPPLTPHTFRHCYASDLYRGGADLSVIKFKRVQLG